MMLKLFCEFAILSRWCHFSKSIWCGFGVEFTWNAKILKQNPLNCQIKQFNDGYGWWIPIQIYAFNYSSISHRISLKAINFHDAQIKSQFKCARKVCLNQYYFNYIENTIWLSLLWGLPCSLIRWTGRINWYLQKNATKKCALVLPGKNRWKWRKYDKIRESLS